MKTETANKILEYLKQNAAMTAHDIIEYLNISAQATFKQLKKLSNKGLISKAGSPPKVFYYISTITKGLESINLSDEINENYLMITYDGQFLIGDKGFTYWCNKNSLDIQKTADDYIKTIKKYNSFKINGLINGLNKLKKTFTNIYLDEIYYLDFYSIERFGKTKLGTLILYAKQSQNKNLIYQIYELIKDNILKLIKDKNIDAVAFVPPTIPRKIQFQKELENLLSLQLPTLKIVKVINNIPIAQKTLNKLEDRIQNANSTIFVDDKKIYKNILLIDDAVGSGATLNETAKKIKEKKLVTGKIIALALVGSFKGFDVINEI